ncbi:hypothetical protein AB5I41_13650 [Sphingomonas sp. MMS24-JH45]
MTGAGTGSTSPGRSALPRRHARSHRRGAAAGAGVDARAGTPRRILGQGGDRERRDPALRGADGVAVGHDRWPSGTARADGRARGAGRVAVGGTKAGRLALDGTVGWGTRRQTYVGTVRVADADVRRFVPDPGDAGAGTPLAPLSAGAGASLRRAAADVAGEADLSIVRDDAALRVVARSARLSSASGATAILSGDRPLDWRSDGRVAGGHARGRWRRVATGAIRLLPSRTPTRRSPPPRPSRPM